MDGDFAPMVELVKLRQEYSFLLVLDDVSSADNQDSRKLLPDYRVTWCLSTD